MPERPIGSALKALAGSNVSRGFESRPLCLTTYRLDRRFVLPAVGLNVILAGLTAALAFFLSAVGAVAWVFGVLAFLALVNAVRLLALPSVAVRTEPGGLRIGGRLMANPAQIAWRDVEDVSVDARHIYIDAGVNGTLVLPLAHVGKRAPELARDIYDRLNIANGYRRFDPS